MSDTTITYRNLWNSLLNLYDKEEAQSIVRIVLEERFGLSLTDIVSGGVEKLSEKLTEELQEIMRRLQQGEPLQYVLGYAYFFGRKFHVAPGVLIPRPETEELCRMIIDDFDDYKSSTPNSYYQAAAAQQLSPKIIDIGTGSGCIAITLAKEITGSEVSAIDISEQALNIARNNAKALDADIHFYQLDILSPSPIGEGRGGAPGFFLIVSNPPYVTNSEKSAMRPNVLDHEPSTALFVPDDDPLLFYRAIADIAKLYLVDGGSLYFEINPLFASELKAMLETKGFTNVEIINDSFGKQRFSKAVFHKKA